MLTTQNIKNSLEEYDKLITLATDAETKEHWFQAAKMWRLANEESQAETCENILQYLVENNLKSFKDIQIIIA